MDRSSFRCLTYQTIIFGSVTAWRFEYQQRLHITPRLGCIAMLRKPVGASFGVPELSSALPLCSPKSQENRSAEFIHALPGRLWRRLRRVNGGQSSHDPGRPRLAPPLMAGTTHPVNYLLHIRRYSLPLRVAVRTAHGIMRERDGIILRLEDEAGTVGHGEVAPVPGFGGGTAGEAEKELRGLGSADAATGARRVGADDLAEMVGRGGWVGFALESALAAMRRGSDIALGSVVFAAPRLGAGGEKTRRVGDNPPHLPDFLPVAALLPAGRRAVEKIGPLAEAGFRTFKWKVGVDAVGEELPLLEDVCAELPAGARLRLDANGAWDRRTAERWLERCAERPVEFVEQPCFAEASQGAARLRRTEDLLRGLAEDYPTAIALDESLAGHGDVERWLEAGWRGVWVIKPSLTGGAEMLGRLQAAKADVVFSSALETAVGARAALRVAFAWNAQRPTINGEHSTSKGQALAAASKPARALGFGVWPLFQDGRFDGPSLAPFLWARDVERINVEAAWNALS